MRRRPVSEEALGRYVWGIVQKVKKKNSLKSVLLFLLFDFADLLLVLFDSVTFWAELEGVCEKF